MANNLDINITFNRTAYNARIKAKYYKEHWRGYQGVPKINYDEFISLIVDKCLKCVSASENDKQIINNYNTGKNRLQTFIDFDIYRCDHVRYYSGFVVDELIKKTHDPVRLMRLYGGNADFIAVYLGVVE